MPTALKPPQVKVRTRLSLVNVFLSTAIGLSVIGAIVALVVLPGLEALLPGCDQMISSTQTAIDQPGTVDVPRVYCFEQSFDASTTGLNIQADNVIIDGKRDLGYTITGSKASISIANRRYVTLRNVATSGSISVVRGDHNRVEDSHAAYMAIEDSSDNTLFHNVIVSTTNRALQIGDIGDLGFIRSDRNKIIENDISLDPNDADKVIDRFVVLKGARFTEFTGNTVTLEGVKAPPADNPTMMVMYKTYNSTIARNTMIIMADPSVVPDNQEYYGGGVLVRDNSSYNIFEDNTIYSNVKRGLWMQSGTAGVPDPADNVIRYNRIYDTYNALNVQSILGNTSGTVIKGNLLYTSKGYALGLSGLHANSSVLVEGNTIVSENGPAVDGEGKDANRTVIFRNNIVVAKNYTSHGVGLKNFTVQSDYNVFHGIGSGSLFSFCRGYSSGNYTNCQNFSSLAAWQSATANDGNSVSGDPMFVVCPTGYPVNGNVSHCLGAGSPALDRGDPILPVPQVGGTRIDIGSFESGLVPCQATWSTPVWSTCDDGRQTRVISETSSPGCNRDLGKTATIQACTSGTDRTPPTAHISDPADGQTVSGSRSVLATAFDLYGVVGVQFKVDGQNIGNEDTSYPYKVTWNTAAVANGNHALTAISRDAAGHLTTSNAVQVNVTNAVTCIESWTCGAWSACSSGQQSRTCIDANNCGTTANRPPLTQTCISDTTPPNAQIIQPINGTTITGDVLVWTFATDNVGVAGVQLLVDGQNFGAEDTVFPYHLTWPTTNLSSGWYTLTARVRDTSGNQVTSAPITVRKGISGGGGGGRPKYEL